MKPHQFALGICSLGLLVLSGPACKSQPSEGLDLPAAGGAADSAGAPGESCPGDDSAATGGAGATQIVPADCPTGDWQQLDGQSCDPDSVPVCFKIGPCSSNRATYVDESLYCFPSDSTWSFFTDSGSCDTSGIELGPDGCPLGRWEPLVGVRCCDEGVQCSRHSEPVGTLYYAQDLLCGNQRWRGSFVDVDSAPNVGGPPGGDGGAGP